MTRTTWVAAAALILVIAAAAAIIINLQGQITDTTRARDQLQTELTAEQGTTAALRTDLTAEQGARANVEDELADTQADLTAEQGARANVEDELADTQADLTAEQEARANVEDELADTQADLTAEQEVRADVEDELADTQADLTAEQEVRADVEDELADTQADLTAEQRKATAAESRAATAAAELRTFQQTVGSLESIQAEIRRLEEERRPLIPDKYTYSPVCTGSMEPVITCLDNVTLLNNINLDDVVIGAVVSVTLADGGGALHRIIDMRNGMVLPKGDNNHNDDGWVPLSNVGQYLVGLEKNVDLGDAWLRQRHNSAYAEYKRLATRYCGGLDHVDSCDTSQSNFRKLYAAWCRDSYMYYQTLPGQRWNPRTQKCADHYESAANSNNIHYGPVSDHLSHDDDGTTEVHYADLTLTDFEAVAILMNPYPETAGLWDYGFIFRQAERNTFHAVVITSDGNWVHQLRTNTGSSSTKASGHVRGWNWDNEEYFFKQLRLVVKGDTGWFYVNGYPHATLDLSTGPASGDVGVVSGFFSGNEIKGQQTPFNEFVIYDISSPAEIPATP